VGLCFVAFMLCNMDRVNMSIAILPMAKQYAWDSQTIGLVQSSFFWCDTRDRMLCSSKMMVAVNFQLPQALCESLQEALAEAAHLQRFITSSSTLAQRKPASPGP
jgi:hypothetical protein